MRPPLAWVLNLDAEHELETRGSYSPSLQRLALVRRERRRLLGSLVQPGDVLLDPAPGPRDAGARGLLGLAWSPTPRALARLSSAGALPCAAPALDVLRHVNRRDFARDVRAPCAADSFAKHVARDLDEALLHLARPASDGWLVRRPFGAAGRGRRRLCAGRPDAAERAWLSKSLGQGPLVIEPFVQVTREYTRSGFVARDGRVSLAAPCLQRASQAGAWLETRAAGAGEVPAQDDQLLEASATRAGQALAAAGYFGPFGIDAFRHRLPGARSEVLNPLSEINARFTMDWCDGTPELFERAHGAAAADPGSAGAAPSIR